MGPKKLITSALPYVNNVPHLGNIVGCVLPADVYARFCRSKGYETLYICATDEYGTATENKAREEGVTPREICDRYHTIHKEVYQTFNIAFDYFGRTSHPTHSEVTQEIFLELDKRGMIEEKETEQTYCEHDQMFLADRYVEGTCPACGSDDARGDQCDACGKLLQPTDIINAKCKICGNPPSRKLTKHLYINLPKLEPRLKEFHKESIEKGDWSSNAISLTQGWLNNGLQSRPITRDLKWGIPVPKEGYETKVFYVWFDAPIGYISATKTARPDDWQKWWQDPESTNLYQFMAKDNIPFHTVVFPATLLGTDQKWTLLHHISSSEYLNYENQKFSKSRNVGVFGSDVIKTDIPIDLWRFYLLFNRPEKSDTNFSWDTFLEDINSNFIDNIGNLINRVLVFYNKHFSGEISSVEFTQEQNEFLAGARETSDQIVSLLDRVQLREAFKTILALGKNGNKFFQDQEPWATIKTDEAKTRSTLTALIFLVRDIGIMLAPYMPDTSDRILKMVGDPAATFESLGQWENLIGQTIGKPEILFPKLQKKEIDKYKAMFSGAREETPDPLEAWRDIRIQVGEIKEIEPHPSADRLYVEKIDCGERTPRTIVSGLVKYYTPDQLLGKRVLVITNLAPAELRGVTSEGMLLAAETKKKLEVIDVSTIDIGTEVILEGVSESENSQPADISIDRFLEAGIVVKNHELTIGESRLLLKNAPITTSIVENGKVR